LHGLSARAARTKAKDLLGVIDLAGVSHRRVGTFSGGMRKRLDLAQALMHDPPLLFLDEPTTGLDPRGRSTLWEQIRAIRDDGAAVVLTTQYLEEADRLADTIVVIDRGRAVAAGTAAELKARLEQDVLEIVLAGPADLDAALAALGGDAVTPIADHALQLTVSSAADSVAALRRLEAAGVRITDFQLRRPTLDDVFIELTGEPAVHPRSNEPEELS
jgi:ABC-2 type transport system ATP-binding protein